jgi:hypothetical protein
MTLKVDDTSNFFHCLVVESGVFELKGCDLTGESLPVDRNQAIA